MAQQTENKPPSIYQNASLMAGVSGRRRRQLTTLHRTFKAPFDASRAAAVLDLSIGRTRRLLASLAENGWLNRVRKGWYISVPLDVLEPEKWLEDPWVVASTIFSPSYIGGWSAAEHWGLTDQIFRVIYVISGRKITPTRQTVQNTDYLIRTVPEGSLFGTRREWRGQVPVDVSDPHRTIIDILDVPSGGGGLLHDFEILTTYFESDYLNQDKLIEYGDRLQRGTVFKRLGYLSDRGELADEEFLETCRGKISKGLSLLDPNGPKEGPIVSRWNLRINSRRLTPGGRLVT